MTTEESDKITPKVTPPTWATEPGHTIPLGFSPAGNQQPDRFFLGVAPMRAIVLLDREWSTAPPEEWVNVAAGAYQAVCGTNCDRDMAELIAKGWLTAAALDAQDLRSLATRIILPEHLTAQ